MPASWVAGFFLFNNASIAQAQIPRTLRCFGNLPVFCLPLDSKTPPKLLTEASVFRGRDCHSFRVGSLEQGFGEFTPWAGIQLQTFQKNIPKDFEFLLTDESESGFHIRLRNKATSYRKDVRCSLKLDLAGPNEKK